MANSKVCQGNIDIATKTAYRFNRSFGVRNTSQAADFDNELVGDSQEICFALDTRERNSSERGVHTQQKDKRCHALHSDAMWGIGRFLLLLYSVVTEKGVYEYVRVHPD